MELVPKCTKSKLIHAISKLATKAGNLNKKLMCNIRVKPNLASDLKTTQIGEQMSFAELEGRNALI
jgi:hypothetical protein